MKLENFPDDEKREKFQKINSKGVFCDNLYFFALLLMLLDVTIVTQKINTEM